MAALWVAQRQKRKRIVYCFNILIDFVLQYTIQRACQNTKDVDYQRCDILALVRECKETLQRGVKEIDRGIWQGRQIADAYRNKDFFEVANLNKKHFLVVGSSLGVPWFIFGSSLVFNLRGIGKVQGKGNLNKSTFLEKSTRIQFGNNRQRMHL